MSRAKFQIKSMNRRRNCDYLFSQGNQSVKETKLPSSGFRYHRRMINHATMMFNEVQELDEQHVWHPYAAMPNTLPCFPVQSASGCKLHLMDGRTIVDGMSSWWACVHGYNHPVLNQAAKHQIDQMSHVMFGGLTHSPAVSLAKALTDAISPNHTCNDQLRRLEKVFYCDSGSVAIEVAMKMALQYSYNLNMTTQKSKFLTIRGGYHGDTFEAMSVCDPVNGMHHLFQSVLPSQFFCPRPEINYNDEWDDSDIEEVARTMEQRHKEIAAVIVEPIVQGAGGMRFYSPQYLVKLRDLCDKYDVLLIFDEIATGFGRTGKLFAMEHTAPTHVLPDILCIGKALSGGFMSFAATVTSQKVADVFKHGPAGVLMHGPTFMGNPLACAVSLASLELLQTYNLPSMIGSIEAQLKEELLPCQDSPYVENVRVLGAIGVVEMKEPLNMAIVQPRLVDMGVWLRPFGKLLYTMPPFIIQKHELSNITQAMVSIASTEPT
ncbi:pyridoxal phosphate-dependent transferase [Nitzschia inconspicua]|uniref:Pyridoxal phosphate-dependent transferase n=1 Tax=Nitzschia inconspicua TaxID=303405 RepID=A0A9K3LIF1_9STRA|nr:pyridoxal phosphate-dependent transferase [Nitzschia inconspicua]